MTSQRHGQRTPPTAPLPLPFARLDHAEVVAAVESLGLESDGRVLALNSYENRVFRVGLHDAAPVVVKFYRGGRWSDAAILEEHAFAEELAEAGVSTVPPLRLHDRSLHQLGEFRLAVFPLVGGRAPELDQRATLESLGRSLGLIHAVGAGRQFRHRGRLDVDSHGDAALDRLLTSPLVPADLLESMTTLGDALLDAIDARWTTLAPATLRLHGDCHAGNLLWRDSHAHFVDFDDCLSGPAMQDLWMLLGGDLDEQRRQFEWLMNGYLPFHRFDATELALIETLRGLRLLHFHAWIAERWSDPAFPAAFPWFGERRQWERLLIQLQEQLALVQESATLSA